VPQNHALATYTCKRTLEDNEIQWDRATAEIYNLIRALSRPYPGAYTLLSGEKLRIWSARQIPVPVYAGRIPGRVVKILPGEGILVLTGDGGLLVQDVQLEMGDVINASELIRSISLTLGK
jgi:methionyl-tRNA formyltransferase